MMASSALAAPSSISPGSARPASPSTAGKVNDLVSHFEGHAALQRTKTACPSSSPESKKHATLSPAGVASDETSGARDHSKVEPTLGATNGAPTGSKDGPSEGSATLEDIEEGEKLQVEQGGKVLPDESGDEAKPTPVNGHAKEQQQGASESASPHRLSTIQEAARESTGGKLSSSSPSSATSPPSASASAPTTADSNKINGKDKSAPDATWKKTDSTTGGEDVPALTRLSEKLEAMPSKERSVVQKNLERVSAYPTDLPLTAAWTLHFSDTTVAAKSSHNTTADDYDDAVKALFTAKTVYDLCSTLKAYKRIVASKFSSSNKRGPAAVKPAGAIEEGGLGLNRAGQNLHFFRAGVSPTWEDPWNSKGGRLIIQPTPAMFETVFERLVFLLAGSAVEVAASEILKKAGKSSKEGFIIGAVASRRARGDRIEVWLGGTEKVTPAPSEWIEAIKERLSEELELPEIKTGKYRMHFGGK
ncbi:BZ3500_MvSof-1268-A1-R1_Chr2-1g04504 [Microbotryum saponariae]|uniref:BZ3500_MvSof-1268-A1-R1_Chr2-1g04504 protein n=1 Tax=Microbotryum saponariae TaxID=289078 RepID=A0A2X0KQZ7_9BASI|nr:BZ3500_MvSof-1268-A1-R1_Chr2-1g04504 [Microbotryum saponariae]SCZ91867.1 BZ3501_MvSof-1269-A2-R1_Chr2-1g04160 [Microbotryum saponariae]